MKERPILMSAPMVRAILNSSKTQTRRVVKPWTPRPNASAKAVPEDVAYLPDFTCYRTTCPYGMPGDRLWLREAFSGPHCMERTDEFAALPPGQWPTESAIWYWADGEPTHGDWTRPRPSIHMPRWASRITLEITEVRVERLQDISEADALAEGYASDPTPNDFALPWYRRLWEQINGEGSWETNPWVWAVSFKRVEAA